MNVNIGAVLALVLALLVATPAGALTAGAAGHYGLQTDGSVQTPAVNVDVAGTVVPVSTTLARLPGQDIDVLVTVPDGETARLDLVDAAGVVVDSRVTDGGRTTVPTDALATGTYYLVLRADGTVHAAERVVFSRHDVSLSVHRIDGVDLSARISVLAGDETPYDAVQVVATDGTAEVVADASRERIGLYTASLSLAAYPPGKYTVYARLVDSEGTSVGMSDAVRVSLSPSGDARTLAPPPVPTASPVPTVTPAPPTSTPATSTPRPATTADGEVAPVGDGTGPDADGANAAVDASDGFVASVDGATRGALRNTSLAVLFTAFVAVGFLVRLRTRRR